MLSLLGQPPLCLQLLTRVPIGENAKVSAIRLKDVIDLSWNLDDVLGATPNVEEAERSLAAALVAVLSLADAL